MIPLPGWLPPLLRILSDRPDAGAVGGKLVRADGTLDQAGGVIFRDGSAVGFGCGDVNPDQPLYNYVREVDYCSGAFLATRRALFTSVGVDLRYHAACYEGADYCFKLRAKGYRAYYQPESAAIHLDRVAAGCRDSPAPQRCQSRDQSTFIDRWNRVLERRRVAPDRFDFTVWHALALRDERRVGDAR